MISDELYHLPISDIWFPEGSRREIQSEHVDTLVSSIRTNDLIHAIIVDKNLQLIAGGHRLEAFRKLRNLNVHCTKPVYEGWSKIPARYAEDYSEAELARIELIENLQQRRLDWKEEAAGLQKIHKLQQASAPNWTGDRTAQLLFLSPSEVSRALQVAEQLADNPEPIKSCESIWSAYKILQRRQDRERSSALEQMFSGIKPAAINVKEIIQPDAKPVPVPVSVAAPEPVSPIVNLPFATWAESYTGQRFNFLHCDFPYGINLQDGPGQGTRKDAFAYDDSPEVYWSLLQDLANYQDKLLAQSCHIMFWFSQNYLLETIDFFTKNFPRFKRQSHMMIWHFIDKSGIAPDTQRYGRRNYETALCFVAGDRKIVQLTELAQGYSGQAGRSKSLHRSEKPYEMLKSFLRMFIDSHSAVLDPTCGSGTALRVAHSLGASHIVGCEIDSEMSDAASAAFIKHVKYGEIK